MDLLYIIKCSIGAFFVIFLCAIIFVLIEVTRILKRIRQLTDKIYLLSDIKSLLYFFSGKKGKRQKKNG
jgi:hypothetical protein